MSMTVPDYAAATKNKVYHIGGNEYAIEKITAKLVFFKSHNGRETHRLTHDEIKADGTASILFSWYWHPPAWPTEGKIGEMYASFHRLEAEAKAARHASDEASHRVWEMRQAIEQYEREHAAS